MGKYGIPYQGSKSQIANNIIKILPSANRFVDLFGGGGAMSHCAALSEKYNSVLYNEINPLLCDLIKDSIKGKYNYNVFKPKFISREEFFNLKDKDGYIKYIWSFSNNGLDYAFGKEKEEFKKQSHNFIVLRCKEGLKYLENYFKDSYYWHIKNIKDTDLKVAGKKYSNIILKIEAIRVTKLYSDKVYNKYKDLSFEEFLNIKNTDIVKTIDELIPNIPKRKYTPPNIRQLQHLQPLQRLEQLERLQRLQQLQQLQQLQLKCKSFDITNKSYKDYIYEEGDLVYCDPPYENAKNYNKASFNHKEFYEWVAKSDFPIYFSSYDISDDRFKVVWEKQKRSLMSQKNLKGKVEKIYYNGK